MANPKTTIEVDGSSRNVTAHKANLKNPAYGHNWLGKGPFFEDYQKKAKRDIPMLILQPADVSQAMSGARSRFFREWGGQVFDTNVIDSRQITPTIHKIILKKPESFNFRPVQFTFLSLMTEAGMDTRPMSIATSPTRPNLEYAVRLSDSLYKRAFVSLGPKDNVTIQGAFGDFVLNENRSAMLIAGGIVFTPLKGMAEYTTDKRLEAPVHLLYSNRTEDEIAFATELKELELINPKFKVLLTLTGENVSDDWAGLRGRISRDLIRKATEGLNRPVYYLCGA